MVDQTQPVSKGGTNVMAVLALVFAIIIPFIGLILALIGRSQLKKNPNLGGQGLLKAV